MSKYTRELGKRSDVQIKVALRGEEGGRTHGWHWWLSMKPCPICKAKDGIRRYMHTNGTKFVCNHCAEKNAKDPKKTMGPIEYKRRKELEKNDNKTNE